MEVIWKEHWKPGQIELLQAGEKPSWAGQELGTRAVKLWRTPFVKTTFWVELALLH